MPTLAAAREAWWAAARACERATAAGPQWRRRRQFQFQFHNFYFQSIEITFENSGQTQKTEFSVAEEFAIIIM